MKISTLIRLFIPVCILLASCQKSINGSLEDNEPPTTTLPSTGNLIRFHQGTDALDDTVHLIAYDTLNRVISIKDSIYNDSLVATYDVLGRLSTISANDGTLENHLSVTYNDAGLITRIDYRFAGYNQRLLFEYNNGVVARKIDYIDDQRSGTYMLWRYYTYQVAGGNIMSMKEYTSSDVLVDETKYTYGTQLNPFKDICLFNFANQLGTEEIINFETYFCKNISTGYANKEQTITSTNTFNSKQKPIKTVSVYTGQGVLHTFTWDFSYN